MEYSFSFDKEFIKQFPNHMDYSISFDKEFIKQFPNPMDYSISFDKEFFKQFTMIQSKVNFSQYWQSIY